MAFSNYINSKSTACNVNAPLLKRGITHKNIAVSILPLV
jgi:hypothetical protein